MAFIEYAPLINTAGLIVLAFAMVFTQWKAGAAKVSTEVIANYAALDKQQKEQISHYEQEFGKLKAEMANMEKGLIAKISKLEGALGEKENQLKMLNEILANRNPELEKVLTEIRDFMKQLTLKNDAQTAMLENAVQKN
jgi:hypothetical protein